jgi:hypothetical protein
MTARATAFALAFLLLAAGASAAPGACCPAGGRAEQAIGAMDCCATMVQCPAVPQAALTTAVRGVETLPAHHALPAEPAPFEPGLPRLISAEVSRGTPADGPPLYHLHAQLLI